MDQADGLFQVGKKRRREVVIVTGANEENFRARIGWQKPSCRRWLLRDLAMKQPGDSQLYALINQVIIGIATMSISTAPHSGTMMKALYENTL